MRGFVCVLSDPVPNRSRRTGGGAEVAPSICAPSFLTGTIEDIRLNEAYVSEKYQFDVEDSCRSLFGCSKRFMEVMGLEFGFTSSSTPLKRLGELIDYFEGVLKKYEVELYIGKKDGSGCVNDVLQYALYRESTVMYNTILVLYASPCHYLSERGSMIYKHFLKFFHDSTQIDLGVREMSDNFYLNFIMDMDEEGDECEGFGEGQGYFKEYRKDGMFWNLFDEVENIEGVTKDSLYEECSDYIKECPSEEKDLFRIMLDGIPTISEMNKYWFLFNPEDDGVEALNPYSDPEEQCSIVNFGAILYSEKDGMSNTLVQHINDDVNCGRDPYGWNIHQWLSPNIEDRYIEEFIRCRFIVDDFSKWIDDFNVEAMKFDKYEQIERDNQQQDGAD